MYDKGTLTLYPSYWRESACKSHFIIWNNRVHWCTWERDEDFWADAAAIEEQVANALPRHFVTYHELAEQIGEIPWDVLQACHQLTKKGLAEANTETRRGEFRRIGSTSSFSPRS